MKKLSVFFFFIFLSIMVNAQSNLQLGSSVNELRYSQSGYFDYSDPEAVNMKVAVWGYVRYPGKYIIPASSTIRDLLSFAGGPTTDAELDKMRIYRTENDSAQTIIDVDYNDLIWADNIKEIKHPAEIKPGDVLIVKGAPRFFFRDYLAVTTSVVSMLISLAILILNIAK